MNELKLGLWKHKKTGNVYIVTGTRINATNDRNGDVMIEYHKIGDMKYVREIKEFFQKFKKVDNNG